MGGSAANLKAPDQVPTCLGQTFFLLISVCSGREPLTAELARQGWTLVPAWRCEQRGAGPGGCQEGPGGRLWGGRVGRRFPRLSETSPRAQLCLAQAFRVGSLGGNAGLGKRHGQVPEQLKK